MLSEDAVLRQYFRHCAFVEDQVYEIFSDAITWSFEKMPETIQEIVCVGMWKHLIVEVVSVLNSVSLVRN